MPEQKKKTQKKYINSEPRKENTNMKTAINQFDIDGSTLMCGGESGGRDCICIKISETRRTADGVWFERVSHKRKDGGSGTEPLPPDCTRLLTEAETADIYDRTLR